MKRISKIALLALTGALALGALTGCDGKSAGDTVKDTYNSVHDSVVDGWNNMVDGFKADAPKYTSSGQSGQ